MTRQALLGVTLDDFTSWCAENNLPSYRAKQVFEWVYAKGARDFEVMTNLGKGLRADLSQAWTIWSGAESRRQASADGTTKLLVTWPDQATCECVLIPDEDRRTACLSSQVGCPVGCAFCASGIGGLQRQLAPGEMVEQALRIAGLCDATHPLSNIVFMGSGEPLANYAAVLRAVRILNAPWGLNMGARRITISTVGLPTQIGKLAREGLQVNLAISLHAPNDELRQELIPWAKRVSIDQLVDSARDYFEQTGREVTIEYILLAGVNDRVEHAHQLARLCHKMRCNLNLIRYNAVAELGFERPTSFAAHGFAEILRSRGVNAHIRKSKGRDIAAACGQLKRRVMTGQ